MSISNDNYIVLQLQSRAQLVLFTTIKQQDAGRFYEKPLNKMIN